MSRGGFAGSWYNVEMNKRNWERRVVSVDSLVADRDF